MREQNVKLKDVQDKLVKITAVLAAEAAAIASGTAPPSPVAGTTPKNLAQTNKRKRTRR